MNSSSAIKALPAGSPEPARRSVGSRVPDPGRLYFKRINELAFGDYFPYAHSTIGDMQDLQNAPLSAVQEFFRQYYPPNNAVLSIAGDFDPDEAMTWVDTYFGGIPAGPPIEQPDLSEPRQEAEKRASPAPTVLTMGRNCTAGVRSIK